MGFVVFNIITLEDIVAPHAQMHDMVDESFYAFQEALAMQVGWDLLSSLENAFVPLTTYLSPGMREDWLYTGRAFSFNPLPINAGWIAVVGEDYGPQTYWRVYLRARFQDGSQGRPLTDLPWDFNARFQGVTYEEMRESRRLANPAKRFGQPDEFGKMCAYICGVHAGFYNGQNVLLDGGAFNSTL